MKDNKTETSYYAAMKATMTSIPKSRLLGMFIALLLLGLLVLALNPQTIQLEIAQKIGANIRNSSLSGLSSLKDILLKNNNNNNNNNNINKNKKEKDTFTTPPPPPLFNALSRGKYIKVGSLDVAITTAVYNRDFPEKHGFNIFLNGWARHKSNMTFQCCFINNNNDNTYTNTNNIASSSSSSTSSSFPSNTVKFIQTKAQVYHVYSQWVVDMQNGEFTCSITQKQLKTLGIDKPLHHVTFTQNSCTEAPKQVLQIDYPKRVHNSVVVCLKISYGFLDPENLVEWMEFHKMVGVNHVVTYLTPDLDERSRKVLLYYNSTGFVHATDLDRAYTESGKERRLGKERWNQQAFVDEVYACNDCKHRFSGMDYIIIMDLDEWIVPNLPGDSIHSVLEKTKKKYPKAGAFSFDSHVTVLEWGNTRDSPLHVMQTTNITNFTNYDGADRNTRWAFISDRVYFVQNNYGWPKTGFQKVSVPNELYTLVHRRKCKPTWDKCMSMDIRQRFDLITRYEETLRHNIRVLPLSNMLPSNSTQYIERINKL